MQTKHLSVAGKVAVPALFTMLAAFAVPVVTGYFGGSGFGLIATAQAEGTGGSGGQGYHGGRTSDTQGQRKGGEATGGHESTSPSSSVKSTLSGEEDEGGSSGGQRGPDETSDAKGPRANQPESGKKGRPNWAGDGAIPEVELGRLNVARSPSHVLEKALTEATANLTSNDTLYTLTFDAALEAIRTGTLPDGTAIVRIDSPLENLALYKELLNTGTLTLSDGTTLTTNMSTVELAAILLGGASDKTIDISDDTVIAINTILDVSANYVKVSDIHDLALLADDVRAAILEEHGE